MKSYQFRIIAASLVLMFSAIQLEASELHYSNFNFEPNSSMSRDTGDVIYITQASPGIIETGSYTHPFVSLEGAMDKAEAGDNVIFLRGNLNTYELEGPILLAKKVLITAEGDKLSRLADGEPSLPIKGIPLIIN